MALFHRHVWEVIEKTEQSSPAEMLGLDKAKCYEGWVDPVTLATRPLIVSSRCKRCGTEKVERA